MEQISDKIIKEILQLPGAKYLAQILAQHRSPLSTWLLEGKYSPEVDQYIRDYVEHGVTDLIDIILDEHDLSFMNQDIINYISKSDKIQHIVNQMKLNIALDNISPHDYGQKDDAEMYRFFLTGKGTPRSWVYLRFTYDPDFMLESLIRGLDMCDKNCVLTVVEYAIRDRNLPEDFKILMSLPDELRVNYALDVLGKLGNQKFTKDDLEVISKSFYEK